MSNPRRSPDTSLARGKACLSCRRRKMRCDGARPVCTQCIRGNRQDDCEYTDNQGRTRTQVLEENVARLQARIQELENPTAAGSSILLHDPYASVMSAQTSIETHYGATGAGASQSQYKAPTQALLQSPTSAPSMSGSGMQSGLIRPGSTPAVMPWWEFEEPPAQVAQWLVQQVIPHARQLNFALSIPRFVSSLSLPTLHPARPHPALLHSIYLWALHLSKADDLMQHETLYLQRAILALQDALGGGSASLLQTNEFAAMRRIHAIQAEVLLAQYFYTLGRFLEGQYHTNAAVSLSLSSGLHHIHPRTSSQPSASRIEPTLVPRGGSTGLFDLSPPRDSVELGERVNVFWAVFTIDRCWAAALNVPSLMGDTGSVSSTQQTRIDTPWPLDTEEYEVFYGILHKAQTTPNSPPPIQPSVRTVQNFLSGQPGQEEGQANETSYTALRAKASALFERATRLGAAYTPGAQPSQGTTNEMQGLSRLVTSFARGLYPLDDLDTRVDSPDARKNMLVIHSLAHAAMIQIHHARAYAGTEPDMEAINVSLVHAGEVVRILEIVGDEQQGGQLDPIFGFIWMLAAQIFAQELNRVHRSAHTPALVNRANALQVNLNRISTALVPLSANPVVAFQIAKINELLQN